MFRQLRSLRGQYPGQFWLIFWGNLFSVIGMSMIWPFMTLYASKKLGLPLTTIASLMTLNSAMALIASFVAGPLADRFGRRVIVIIGMALHGLIYFSYIFAESLPAFLLLTSLSGFINPLYQVGLDAMIADLIPGEKRVDAYALIRMSNNVGVALGPSIGGFAAATSYTIPFGCAAVGLVGYSLMFAWRAKETLPALAVEKVRVKFGGYGRVLKDRLFLRICSAFTISVVASSMIFVLLSVYVKDQFGIPESQYGFIMAANAATVVLFQVLITNISKRFNPYRVLMVGAVIYAAGVGSVAFGSHFWGFLASIIILTFGEMLLVPTTTMLVANLAPADMRGRYMSLYGLTYGIAYGVGPLIGGLLNDYIAPAAIWYGGGLIGLVSVFILFGLAAREKVPAPQSEPAQMLD
ncbi:MAG: MFS transporter [Anaerolineaceae bacterium]